MSDKLTTADALDNIETAIYELRNKFNPLGDGVSVTLENSHALETGMDRIKVELQALNKNIKGLIEVIKDKL